MDDLSNIVLRIVATRPSSCQSLTLAFHYFDPVSTWKAFVKFFSFGTIIFGRRDVKKKNLFATTKLINIHVLKKKKTKKRKTKKKQKEHVETTDRNALVAFVELTRLELACS